MPQVPMAARSALLFAFMLLCFAAPRAQAETLPLVLDGVEGSDDAWWVDDHAAAGACAAAITAADGFIDVAATAPTSPVSRVYRRPDITEANARNLASLYGAEHALLGRVAVVEARDGGWAGRSVVTIALDARWLGVDGSDRTLALTRTGIADDAGAARRVACSLVGAELSRLLAGRTVAADAWEHALSIDADVVIRSDGDASAYVGVRRALRAADAGVDDLVERWATEGAVGLRVVGTPAARQAVVDAAAAMEGSRVDGGRVERVETVSGRIVIDVAAEPADDAANR